MMEEGQVSEPGDPSTRSAARQWRRRGAAALLLMIVAAIIAGVLVTRQKQITSSTKIDASQALPKHQKKDESLITTKSSIETSASFQSDSSEITPLPPVTSDSKTGPTSLTFQNAVAESNANSKGTNLSPNLSNLYGKAVAVGQNSCYPKDASELQDAIEVQSCPLIILTSVTYELSRELVVSRPVIIMGHPVAFPKLDAQTQGAERAIRVTAGGSLDLRFVRILQGAGKLRDRFTGENPPSLISPQVLELRGACVLVEEGAIRATFNNVIFQAIATAEQVAKAVTAQALGLGARYYGGHVCIAGGVVSFLSCHWFNLAPYSPITDVLYVGGDVLLLAGVASFTGCTWTTTVLIGHAAVAGASVTILGGVLNITWSSFHNFMGVLSLYGIGTSIFVGAGVAILTGVNISGFVGCLNAIGVGSYVVGAGALIMTGVTIDHSFGLLSVFGAGFYACALTGLLVQTGVAYYQSVGPNYLALTGALTFIGSGTSINIGVPISLYATNGVYQGQGTVACNAAGISVFVGCPIAIFAGIGVFMGLGGVVSQDAGLMVWIGNPVFVAYGINLSYVLGTLMFVGRGSAMIGYSRVVGKIGLKHSNEKAEFPFWIDGGGKLTDGRGPVAKFNKDSILPQYAPKQIPKVLQYLKKSAEKAAKKAAKGSGGTVGARDMYNTDFLFVTNVSSSWPSDSASSMALSAEDLSWVPAKMLQAAQFIESNFTTALRSLSSSSSARRAQAVPQADENAVVTEANPSSELAPSPPPPPSAAAAAAAAIVTLPVYTEPSTLYLEQPENDDFTKGYCEICGVDSVDGPGLSQCTQECSDPGNSKDGEDSSSWDAVPFEAQYIIIGQIMAVTPPDVVIDASTLKLGTLTWMDGSSVNNTQVTAFSNDPDELTSNWLSKPDPSSKTTTSCSGSSSFQIVFVAHDSDDAETLQRTLSEGDEASEMTNKLIQSIKDVAFENGQQICDVELKLLKKMFVPAYNSDQMKDYQAGDLFQASGVMSLVVSASDQPKIPIHELVPKQLYSIQVTGFSPFTELTTRLTSSTNAAYVVQVGRTSITTDADGNAYMLWRMPSAVSFDEGYFKTTDATGSQFAFTEAYPISNSGTKRRKLYGPFLRV